MDAERSREDYLENILVLTKEGVAVRGIDLAKKMEYSKPSVSVAMKKLDSERFIKVDKDGVISLTEKGLARAQKIYEKHLMLTVILMELGVEQSVAVKDACKIEHDISDQSFEKVREFYFKHINSKA
ncbi:MAG: metal-dependent transcriptional regulator [Oscillospiraceae bacterium]